MYEGVCLGLCVCVGGGGGWIMCVSGGMQMTLNILNIELGKCD